MNQLLAFLYSALRGITQNRVIGRKSAGTGRAELLDGADLRTIAGVYSTAEVDAALTGKQATLVSGTNIKTVNSTSLLGSGDIVISAGIGGSTGATDNRVLRSDGTGGATLQNSAVSIDDSGNVSGVGTLTASGTANAGTQVLRVQGSGGGFTRLNDNGTVVIDADVASGSTPLSVRYNGTEQWGISFSGILSGRSGCTLNIGAGQMHLTHSGNTSQINTFGNLAIRPGNLGGGGTSLDVTGAITASGLMCAGSYTVATLPSASANAGKFAQVTDSSVTTFGSTVAGSGSNRVPVFSNGTNWVVA